MLQLCGHYKQHPPDFINDWGITYDPRNIERGLPAYIPFVLFAKQEEWIYWVIDRWQHQERGLTEKSRDMGVTWLMATTSVTLCLFYLGMSIGVGSRKEEYVDLLGSPKCIFWKIRLFVENLPIEFRGSWDRKKDSPHMRCTFRDQGSQITGEVGDGIGRGDRQSIYFVDESAHLEHPQLAEASLSNTTNCHQDLSSVNGLANAFAQNRHSGKHKIFTFHWRDDPRKDEAWYARMCAQYDPVTIAQEVDINYSASAEGVVIPSAWVQAAINAHIKLGIEPTGDDFPTFDVADQGVDKNAMVGAHGVRVYYLDEWSGRGDDIFGSVQHVFDVCDEKGWKEFRYDGDGLGAGVRGDARVLNERRLESRYGFALGVIMWRGSGEVAWPEYAVNITGRAGSTDRKNKDFFANAKAQGWWAVRVLFQNTYRAIMGDTDYDKDEIISLDKDACDPELFLRLVQELSQPTYKQNTTGKMLINKTPDGTSSPNLADALMMRYAPMGLRPALKINLDTARALGVRTVGAQ